MSAQHTTQGITVRGIVIPTDWDSRGGALRVAILTPDEMQYDISETGLGKDLLHLLREEVEACVQADEGEEKPGALTVLSYSIIDATDEALGFDDIVGRADTKGW